MLDTPNLRASLEHYSELHQESQLGNRKDSELADFNAHESVLLLRLQAAASYYSTNRTLMLHPPPVDVDISTFALYVCVSFCLTLVVLDPFVLNVFPQSLGPVAIYITLVALGGYLLSGYIYRLLLSVAAEPPNKPHTD